MADHPGRRRLIFGAIAVIAISLIGGCAVHVYSEYRVVQERREFLPTLYEDDSSVRLIAVPGEPRPPKPLVRWLLGDVWSPAIIYSSSADKDGDQIRRARELFPEGRFYTMPDQPGFMSLEGKHWMI